MGLKLLFGGKWRERGHFAGDLLSFLFPAPNYGIESYGEKGRLISVPYPGSRLCRDPVIWHFGGGARAIRLFDNPGIG